MLDDLRFSRDKRRVGGVELYFTLQFRLDGEVRGRFSDEKLRKNPLGASFDKRISGRSIRNCDRHSRVFLVGLASRGVCGANGVTGYVFFVGAVASV
jgi:hypothetical protein